MAFNALLLTLAELSREESVEDLTDAPPTLDGVREDLL